MNVRASSDERALTAALALPERDGDRGPRFGWLQALVQMQAEAGLWDLAEAALPDLLSGCHRHRRPAGHGERSTRHANVG